MKHGGNLLPIPHHFTQDEIDQLTLTNQRIQALYGFNAWYQSSSASLCSAPSVFRWSFRGPKWPKRVELWLEFWDVNSLWKRHLFKPIIYSTWWSKVRYQNQYQFLVGNGKYNVKRTHNNLCDTILQKKSVADNLPSVRWVSIAACFFHFLGKRSWCSFEGAEENHLPSNHWSLFFFLVYVWWYRELIPAALGCETHRFWCWTLVKDRTFAGAKLVGSPASVATRAQICQLVLMRDGRMVFKIFQGDYLRMKGLSLRWNLHQLLGCLQDFDLAIHVSGEGGRVTWIDMKSASLFVGFYQMFWWWHWCIAPVVNSKCLGIYHRRSTTTRVS